MGELNQADSYAQGFEVYFKLNNCVVGYIPKKGDLINFRSYWVDDKAQAREIRYVDVL